MFTRILVPTDFSPPSDAALEYAKAVASRFGASLHLLYVADDPYRAALAAEVFVPEVEGLRDEIIASALTRLKEQLTSADATALRAKTTAIIGIPAWSVVEYAEGHDIDLIIMGTHGRGGMAHLLVGSVAERVLRTAPCPVLTVRHAPVTVSKAAPAVAATVVPPALVATSTADREC